MDPFADIRPYHDHEVAEVVARLLADDECIQAISRLKLGSRYGLLGWLVKPLVRRQLSKQLQGVDSVRGFQEVVKVYMDDMIETHMSGFSVSGLDALAADQPYLFMSNHRDITLDPAFVNYSLYHNGHDTVRIAIGDNLLTKPFVSDLMRINKSFIVNRSAKGRQMLAAYKQLSAYMRHSIEEDKSPIWIAQREGRAKDGRDKTEPAIIKMVAMSQQKKTESFGEFIGKLNLVPVAISYELDPNDAAKAKELYEAEAHGSYKKAEHEDVQSIARGIAEEKGQVHVAYGTPLDERFESADEVAQEIDRQVISHYVLHPSSFFAYKMLHGEYPEGVYSDQQIPFSIKGLEAQEQAFQQRINAMPEAHRPYALGIYANIIELKQTIAE